MTIIADLIKRLQNAKRTAGVANGYHLEAGTGTNELQELEYFATMAVYALHHQKQNLFALP